MTAKRLQADRQPWLCKAERCGRMGICLWSVSACRSKARMRRLAGKEEMGGGKPHPKCLEGLANMLTAPSAFLLGMTASKPLACLAQPCILCLCCPSYGCALQMPVVSPLVFSPATLPGARGTSCLQLLCCSTAVGLGLPYVTALSFDQQRWDCAAVVVLGSVCRISLWSELLLEQSWAFS